MAVNRLETARAPLQADERALGSVAGQIRGRRFTRIAGGCQVVPRGLGLSQEDHSHGQRDAGGVRITQAQSIGKGAKCVQSDVGHHACLAEFKNHEGRVDTVHLGSALVFHGIRCLDNSSFPYARAFPGTQAVQVRRPRE